MLQRLNFRRLPQGQGRLRLGWPTGAGIAGFRGRMGAIWRAGGGGLRIARTACIMERSRLPTVLLPVGIDELSGGGGGGIGGLWLGRVWLVVGRHR